MHRKLRAIAMWLGLIACAPLALLAQDRGALKGVITAAAGGAPIAGARVASGLPVRVAVTDANGAYQLKDLPVGTVEITVSAIGHDALRQAVTIATGTTTYDAKLKKGSIMLSGVFVTASGSSDDAHKVAGTVNTLSAEQVRTSPASTVQDMLREIPGVELARTSSTVGGTAQIVSIRGVDEGRTAVLVDGIPLNDAWGEWIDWDRMPKGSVERVEVLEGGGSSLYGNGAMGGVISFFSRPIAPGSYRFTLDGGSRNARHGFASVGVPLVGALNLALTGDYAEGGGYTLIAPANRGAVDIDSWSIRRNAMAKLEYSPSATFNAFLTGHLFGDDRHLGTKISQAVRTDGAADGGLNYRTADGSAIAVRAWNREMRETTNSTTLLTVATVTRADERRTSYSRIPSYDRGASATWNKKGLLGTDVLSVGADYRSMSGFFDQQDYANTTANAATTHITSGGVETLSGAYVSGLWSLATAWRFEASARVDHWSNTGAYAVEAAGTTNYPDAKRDAFSPRLGLKYQLAPALAFHTALYQAFRAPNLAELYRKQVSSTTISIPNPDLKPEFATGYEVGMDWQPADWFQMKGTIYQANYTDFNTFVTLSTTSGVTTRQRQNVQKAKSVGGEVYLALRPLRHLEIGLSGNYDDARVVDLGPTAPTALVFVGARIGRVPQQRGTARITYDNRDIGTFTVLGRYESTNTTLGNSFTIPDFGVVDFSAQRHILGDVNLFVSVENVFDRPYYVTISGTTAAPIYSLGLPRTLRVGLEVVHF